MVEDSPTMKELLVAILQEAGDIQIVGTGANGEEAIRLVKRLRPDLLAMDINMPVMDGLEATRRIMRDHPLPIVLMSASMKRADVDLTFQGLQSGALQVLNKPGLNDEYNAKNMVSAIRLMSSVPVVHHWGRANEPARPPQTKTQVGFEQRNEIHARLMQTDVIGIGSSTGGPAALAKILRNLDADFSLPLLIVQHVSPGFAPGLCEWLNEQTSMKVELACHGDQLRPGTIFLAPDDYHMQISERGVIELSKAPVYKGLRPSANFLFSSLARVYGARATGIILTGMGDDGAAGLEDLHLAGGFNLAQDEESCVVYGMPKEAVLRNAVNYILSLDQIACLLKNLNPAMQKMPAECSKEVAGDNTK